MPDPPAEGSPRRAGPFVNAGDPAGGARGAAESRYATSLSHRRQQVVALEKRERLLSLTRLVTFAAVLGLGWLAFGAHLVSAWWVLAPPVVFGVLAIVHELVVQIRRRRERAVSYYEQGLDRLAGRWAGRGTTGARFADPRHPYAADLDLFGAGSLFERLCLARTRAGEERLAAWLLHPAPPSEIRERQQAVDELRQQVELREQLFVAGTDLEVGIEPEALRGWAQSPLLLSARAERVIALGLAILSIAGILAWIVLGTGLGPLAGAIALQLLFRLRIQRRVQQVAGTADRAATDLRLLADVLRVFERQAFQTPRLSALRERLVHVREGGVESDPDGRRASDWIRLLQRQVDCLEARRNSMFAPVAFLLLWDVQFAFAVESWRRRVGAQVADWLDSVAELEALSSIAGYAFERPDDPFPELRDEGAAFLAEEMRHPLLADAVPNSVFLVGAGSGSGGNVDSTRVGRPEESAESARASGAGSGSGAGTERGAEPALLVISGSNMSGKSTMLRTTGILLVLAQAGAPVSARRMSITPLALGASIQIHDSIQTGVSHFYAEVLRLRQIVELTEGDRPTLFLVDEILQGTNSHDRRVGVEAVLHSLVERGAIGMISTHDLALTEIATAMEPRARNVHFEDQLQDGRMVFDYRLREGIVTHSNAIALMRSVGLRV